jgi:hypothetical protein
MKKLMSVTLIAGLVAASSLAGVLSAQAMTLAPLASGSNAIVTQVAGGCGPGKHRGPYGGCLNNYARPDLHACPRGYHIGPGGRCRGNGR